MSRYLPSVLIALCAALGVALAVQRSSLSTTRQEVEQLQARLERVEARQKESAARKAVEELQEQVARAERKAAAASVAADAAAAAAARPAPKDAAAPVAFTEEDIQKIVDAKIEEKIQKKGGGKQEDRKMPLFELAKELTLDPVAQTKVASIANTAKKEIFDILKTPRPDGSSAAEDVIKAFTGGDQAEAQKVFLKLFTEKIPGTDTPYVTAVARVQEKANQGLSLAMGPQVFEKYRGMNLKPENIETGFDPWQEYLQQRGK
ncbi:MAG: hypothetical protein HY293_15970 [Planctomycetes bacterium]|nr:hypothetical protein [Planctomycetota bacterium]